MNTNQTLLAYVSRLGDNALILGQRMVEVVAVYPDVSAIGRRGQRTTAVCVHHAQRSARPGG